MDKPSQVSFRRKLAFRFCLQVLRTYATILVLPIRYLGPTGVWALEVKTFTGEYRNIGEQWEYRAGNRWRLANPSPSRQAQDNAVWLSRFFRADGIKQWVTPAVAWANPESPLAVENPMVAIWILDHLLEELGNIWQ